MVSCCVIFPGGAVAQTVAGPAPPARESAIPVIDSVAAADAALAAVNLERTAQEARHASARRLCFDKLLAERCLSEARMENHVATARLRDIELAARSFKRNDELQRIDQARATRAVEARADARRREAEGDAKLADRQARAAESARQAREFEATAPERAAGAAERRAREQARAQARARKDAEARAGMAERAERVRRHEAKVAEAQARAERRAREAARKAATQAATKPVTAPVTKPVTAPVTKPAQAAVSKGVDAGAAIAPRRQEK